MDCIEFKIELDPVVASRPRVGKWGTYYAPKYQAYKDAAAWMLKRTLADLPQLGDTPVSVELEFVCRPPKTRTRDYPRGDNDNYQKAALDAITACGLWDDDDQIIVITASKRYADKDEDGHTRVRVTPL